jgi:peptidyl-prolyl cis-trans isomerase SurA
VRSKFFARSSALLFALALTVFGYASVHAQEGEQVVVDEVIAQVNNDVIMLSALKREMKEAAEALVKSRGMTQAQAEAEVEKRKPELIATLVNEKLLLDKGKELELTSDIEAEVNKRMMDVAKEQNIKTIAELDQALTSNGLDPVAIRQTLRVELMKGAVLQREVDAKIYYGLNDNEMQTYFKAHQDKFRKPEVVKLSEIFLSFAGKNPAEVQNRANQLIQQARSGGDFRALATANSERMDNGVRVATTTGGEVGSFDLPNLREDIAAAIKNLPVGGTTDPIKTEEGISIIHVDARTPGSDAAAFNEQRVREAITQERAEKEREQYLQGLRNDAYIKIADSYSASVLPLLKVSSPITASSSATTNVKNVNEKKQKSKNKQP